MDRPARRPGPPVDAARLQPDNQGDIQDVDEGLVGAWLDDPDLAAELADELTLLDIYAELTKRLEILQGDQRPHIIGVDMAAPVHDVTVIFQPPFAHELQGGAQ